VITLKIGSLATNRARRLGTALAACLCTLTVAFTASPARAAEPWSCICHGVTKRFLASTRHCEFQLKLQKGQWCTKEQFRKVYGPACRQEGCKLAPLE